MASIVVALQILSALSVEGCVADVTKGPFVRACMI